MYPFTFKKIFYLKNSETDNLEIECVIDAFKYELDSPKLHGNRLKFDNLNSIARQKWVDGGELVFNRNEENITVTLRIDFYMVSVVLGVVSLVVLFAGDKPFWLGILGMFFVLLILTILYIISCQTFCMTIIRTIDKLKKIDNDLNKKITKR